MRYMGWGWEQLCNAPAELIDVLIERIVAEAHYQEIKTNLDKVMKK